MTYVEEYNPGEGTTLEEEIENYPTAFGITFTPQVTGIALAVLGLAGAIYLGMNLALPAYQKYQDLKAQEQKLNEDIKLQETGAIDQKLKALEADLQRTESLKQQVLALFSNARTMDTLLIDINQFFRRRKVDLLTFQPSGEAAIITDSSLGEAVNNRLKRQSINLSMEGGFEQTQSILRDLERLQPLILVKNLNTQSDAGQVGLVVLSPGSNQATVIPQANKKLKTSLTLDVIFPLSPEELAKLAPPPAQNPPEQKN